MKKNSLILLLLTTSLIAFSQAREEGDSDNSRKIYSIILSKQGKVKHIIKQGAMMSSKVDGKVIKGKWFFKAYPDIVVIRGNDGSVLGEVALNDELPLRIIPPQQQSRVGIGIGVGPVSVSGLGGGGMKNFDMKKYRAEIDERPETKDEKMKREYYLKERKEQQEKEAAKKAKKDAKNAAKNKKKK